VGTRIFKKDKRVAPYHVDPLPGKGCPAVGSTSNVYHPTNGVRPDHAAWTRQLNLVFQLGDSILDGELLLFDHFHLFGLLR